MSPPADIASGSTVVVSEDLVNLRVEPSSSAEIITELPIDTQLTVTGDPVEADGYTWYPVDVVASSQTGFIVADFIEPVEE
jgi:hypothetical protein